MQALGELQMLICGTSVLCVSGADLQAQVPCSMQALAEPDHDGAG